MPTTPAMPTQLMAGLTGVETATADLDDLNPCVERLRARAERILRRPRPGEPGLWFRVECGKDNKWGYAIVGANGDDCAISTTRYPNAEAAWADIRRDFAGKESS